MPASPVVLIADPLAPEAEQLLVDAAVSVRHVTGAQRPDLLAAVGDADALVVRSATRVDREVFEAAPRLRVVSRAGVGIDNIDVDAATAHGVLVANTPAANVHSAAEHSVALLLAAARNIPAADASTRAGRWERSALQGVELHGKTAGVVGFGRVGQLVAERLAAFGMRVVAYDPVWDREASIRIGVEYADLDELVAHSDVVTIHVPRTEATRALFDARRLAGAKPGQILVNASRGGVVDERALADVLRDGPLRAAGIDVFEEEPPADSPLLACGNVVLTPHLGASTREAQLRAGEAAVDAVLRALRGEGADVPGAVNAEALARQ